MKHRLRKVESVYQRHAAQIYAEMLGQVCHRGLYDSDRDGFQEVASHCNSFLSQSFVLHARHATFYIFYAKFPNTYLRDIVRYGAGYKTRVTPPVEVIIQQSRPFRMRKPKDNAEFFKLVSKLLYYIISGQSRTGYLATGRWNKYYLAVLGVKEQQNQIDENKDKLRGTEARMDNTEVCNHDIPADFQSRPIYECIVVRPYDEEQTRAPDEVLNEEGELDGESDADDQDVGEDIDDLMEDTPNSVTSSSHGADLSWDSRIGSPMDES
jgi:hypothetical protein